MTRTRADAAIYSEQVHTVLACRNLSDHPPTPQVQAGIQSTASAGYLQPAGLVSNPDPATELGALFQCCGSPSGKWNDSHLTQLLGTRCFALHTVLYLHKEFVRLGLVLFLLYRWGNRGKERRKLSSLFRATEVMGSEPRQTRSGGHMLNHCSLALWEHREEPRPFPSWSLELLGCQEARVIECHPREGHQDSDFVAMCS